MITFKELFEAKDAGGHGSEKHHVTAFTRMNPPTTGHMQVISKLHAVAKEHGAEHSLVVSHSNDAKKNPLSADQKIKHLNRYSPETKVSSSSKESPTILHHAAELHKKGVQHLHVVAGSDRHEQMHKLLHQYNGKEAGHGHYNFKSITMHSSGDRDPDSEGTEGMSGTKMRQHAHDNNFKEFRKGVPSHVSDKHAHELMSDVRKGSGIKEEAISYQTFMEVRMSAAVKLQRAFEREQQKSAASRERAKELLAPKKPEPVKEDSDPCWVGYKQLGMKKKNGKDVPNCVPVKEENIDETIVKVDSGYEVHSETGKNLGGSPSLAGAKKRLKQVEYFKHMKEEEMQFEDFDDKNLAKQDLSNKKNKGGFRGHIIAALKRKAGLNESVHDNRTGFAKKKREDDEGGELYRHTYKYTVSKPGVEDGKKHERHVTTPLTTRKKGELEHLARAHITKQGYQIHEEVVAEGEERGAYEKKSPVVIAPKDPKAKTYGKIVSKIRTMAEEIDAHAKSEENKKSADAAHKQGDMFAHHMHMADHHDNLSQWHSEKGRHGVADSHAAKAEEHHEKAMSLKEETIEEATPYYNKPSFLKKMGRVAKQERLAREKKEAEAKKPVKEQFDQEFTVLEEAAKSIDKGEYDYEGQMARTQLQTTLRNCTDLIDMIQDDDNMPEWVQSKITLAQDYITTVRDYLQSKEELEEAATGAKPGWMLRQDPALAKKLKDQLARKKFVAGEPTKKPVKEETQETEMGLKSFITLVKEGMFKVEEQAPQAPQAPTLDRKYIKGTPEHKAYKATKKPINGMPTGKYNEELEEGMMDTVKKVAKKAAEVLGGPDDEGHKKDLQKKMGVPQTGKVGMAKQNEEVEQIEEANHREFASQGKMHPDMAKHMKTGQETDFYHSKTGDKISGVVKHTTDGEVHIKAHKDGKMGAGDVHKFKVSSTLDEAAKHVAPTNKKPAIDIDKVNAAGQEPHEETFEKAPKPVRKEGYTVSDLLQALKEGMWPGTPEYKAKFDGAKQGGGSGVKKGSRYGGSLQKDEPETDEEPATAGRKVGSKSGARKNLGNSKLHK